MRHRKFGCDLQMEIWALGLVRGARSWSVVRGLWSPTRRSILEIDILQAS